MEYGVWIESLRLTGGRSIDPNELLVWLSCGKSLVLFVVDVQTNQSSQEAEVYSHKTSDSALP